MIILLQNYKIIYEDKSIYHIFRTNFVNINTFFVRTL